jgi:ABC-2 type transport system ATP-binding protein
MTAGRAERITKALEQTGLNTDADRAVGGYSAGMRQRLGLAAVLLRRPQLLFLDEPTSSLDPAGARDVRETARRLADEGTAVVFSSHDGWLHSPE